MSTLENDLSAGLDGEVDFSVRCRAEYSYDASVYRRVPLGVVFPRSADDVAAAVRAARDHGVAITARGAGTSIAGNAIGEGLVVDFSRHMNRILELDHERRIARVEPGVVLDDLNRAAGRHGLRFGPDPSSRSRCVLAGMIGNNACGTRALVYGRTSDNVESLDVLRYDGTALTVGAHGKEPADPFLEELRALRDRHLATIRTSLGRFPRQVSGYGLEHLLPENDFNVARSLVGSEGTCAFTLGATLRLVSEPETKVLVIAGFPDFVVAGEAVPRVLEYGPDACEGLDAQIVQMARGSDRSGLPEGTSWLLIELTGDDAEERARALAREFPGAVVETDPLRQAAVWKIRTDGAGLATRAPDGSQAWPGWEDSAVPPDRLGAYLGELRTLFARFGVHGAAYGHFGEGCLHIRIDFDLATERGRKTFREVIEEATRLVAAHGGSPSGEHGDGRARSEVLPLVYDDDTLKAFREFKGVWDPEGRMNPGVLVDPEPVDDRLRTEGMRPRPRTFLPFAADNGDFRQALHRCVGVGKCRSDHGGVMCPSYRATHDEKDSTRGRARALEEMLRGDLDTAGWRSESVHEALDLCLACKGCASDCPVNVDMATYKSEFLHHHYRRRLRPMAHYSMGWLPVWLRLARGPLRAASSPGRIARSLAGLGKRLGGVAPERDLPAPAKQPFTRWFRRHHRAPGGDRKQVLLWPDTFTNHFTPSAARAAVRVLEDAGYEVIVPQGQVCCGLTWMSTGQLAMARRVARRSLEAIHPYAARGIPIVGLEPSCTAALRGDWEKLLPGDERLADLKIRTFAELLEEAGWTPPHRQRTAIAQIHCHQHAELGQDADLRLLAKAGVEVTRPESGCCGLAGNFGFEKGHYDVSVKIAERGLAPAVRDAAPGTIVLADGFSCRTQIAQLTGRDAVHLAEVLLPEDGHQDTDEPAQ
ncbi:FAD-binding oxidoreductase [Actinoallomurus sp. NBC_01490]|uniref:FAD-binding and (Fe-S)-binding domain-containing protein n=1 Tax=Actinoallomurus sp. NBC_01490 TaxID=2903557 RepID=UPI002E331057|nr:FAD-binding and (Fe-S)-binding domain-containing protein [Actinoallomurus sp. NBC_01490]